MSRILKRCARDADGKTQMKILALALFVFQSWSAFASTAIFMVTKRGIVAATDGKSFLYEDRSAHVAQKLFLFHGRILVAQIGLIEIRTSEKALREMVNAGREPEWVKSFIPYQFASWIAGIEQRTPRDISVATLAQTVKDEADRTFRTATPLFRELAMNHQPPFDDEKKLVAVFMLAGFDDNGAPVLFDVTIELNREDFTLIPGKIECRYPKPGARADYDTFYMPPGSAQKAIANLVSHPESDDYKRSSPQTKRELRMREARSLTSIQEKHLLTTLISKEIVASSDEVGWPIWFGSIPKVGKPTLRQIRKPMGRAKN